MALSRHAPVYLLLLISLCLNGYFYFSRQKLPEENQIHVARIIDGDTFTLQSGERIKLIGVDAPELTDCLGEESKSALEKLLQGKTIQLAEEKRDGFGRRMALVYTSDKTLINTAIVQRGFARIDYTPNSQSELFKTVNNQAKNEKIGIYSDRCKLKAGAIPANSSCTIKGNIDLSTNSKLYHLPTCRHYNQIVIDFDRGEKIFCSEPEATASGFQLAPDCLR